MLLVTPSLSHVGGGEFLGKLVFSKLNGNKKKEIYGHPGVSNQIIFNIVYLSILVDADGLHTEK